MNTDPTLHLLATVIQLIANAITIYFCIKNYRATKATERAVKETGELIQKRYPITE